MSKPDRTRRRSVGYGDRLSLRHIVERLLAARSRPMAPGMTLGLVLDDELATQRSVGLASLEMRIAIGVDTRFRIASLSKQFTCSAILLLAADGLLRVDDLVREWLPELSHLDRRVTLDHLMRNTSGIRDMIDVMRFGGVDLPQPIGADDLLAAIGRQRRGNFVPGSRYLYSNSNFLLLGRVAERASGIALGELLARRIFAPLGMDATRHVEDPSEPVPGLATGYMAAPAGGWRRAQHGFPLHGEGALVSSVRDLARWHTHLASPAGAALARGLTTRIPFANGRPNAYVRGLGLRRHRGLDLIEHSGLWPGYKAAIIRIPARRMAAICLANDGTAEPQVVAMQALDAVLDQQLCVAVPPRMPDDVRLERWAGRWIDRRRGATADLAVKQDGGMAITSHGVASAVRPIANGRFANTHSSVQFTLRLLPDAIEIEQAGAIARYRRVAHGAILPRGLDGSYASEEIAATWSIRGAVLTIAGWLRRGTRWLIEPIDGDVFRVHAPTSLNDNVWLDVRALRDGRGRVSGLHVDGARVRELVFSRIRRSPGAR